jgi:hypothetical protein
MTNHTPEPQPPEASTEFFGAHRYANDVLDYQHALRAYIRDYREWARAELARKDAELTAQAARIVELEALIGQPPEGSHPDEWYPRARTWHAERLNWSKEVAGLYKTMGER